MYKRQAKNSKGTIYPYFVCARRCRLHDCAFTAVLIDVVEDGMVELYRTIQLSAADRTQIEHYLHDELAQIEGDKDKAIRSLTTRRTNIEDKRRRLLHAHYQGAVPLEAAQGGTSQAHERAEPDRAPANRLPSRRRRSPPAPHPGP